MHLTTPLLTLSALFTSSTVLAQNAKGQDISGKCQGQSCYIAKLSTSTEEPYKLEGGVKPTGGNASGDKCVKSYYQKLGLAPPEGLRRFARNSGGENAGNRPQDHLETIKAYLEERRSLAVVPRGENAACQPNTMIFARGTLETGILGTTVGPALKRALTTGWEILGVDYPNTMDGIKCNGMPGGWIAKGMVEDLHKRCPATNIVTAGYSQGAMVARFAAAWASEGARKQIKGVLLYGDPFNGASVKGISQEKVKTICNNSDGVCKGALSIGMGHLSYTSDGSIKTGVDWVKQVVAA